MEIHFLREHALHTLLARLKAVMKGAHCTRIIVFGFFAKVSESTKNNPISKLEVQFSVGEKKKKKENRNNCKDTCKFQFEKSGSREL